jgi:predicted phosphodiesterase
MRIAVLADVHGNLPALRAVLAELDREPVETIVVGGDVVAGPLVRESLDLLAARPGPVRWISGNGEREALAAYAGEPVADDAPGRAASWSARALDRRWRDELATWPISLALDGVMFCHGSPRRDDEILTRDTPDELVIEAISGVAEPLVIGGHTHQQVVRALPNGLTYANAGSVGLPYEGRPGAFWMVVDDGVPELRQTEYDLEAALGELRASGFPELEDHLEMSLFELADPDWVTSFFEYVGGRGANPPAIGRGDEIPDEAGDPEGHVGH